MAKLKGGRFMLLNSNTERVMNLIDMVDDLNGIDKIRLAIHILEDLGFIPNYDITNFIKILKEVLELLDTDSKKVITNFAKYKNLLFISAKYMELSTLEKQKFFENHGWKIIQIYYKWCYGTIENNKVINSIFDLPIHNKEYVKEIYKRSYIKEQEKLKLEKLKQEQKQEIEEQHKQIIYNLINNSGIDFTKQGWSKQVINYLANRNELWNKGIFRCIRKYYPEFLQREDIWKRKGSKLDI